MRLALLDEFFIFFFRYDIYHFCTYIIEIRTFLISYIHQGSIYSLFIYNLFIYNLFYIHLFVLIDTFLNGMS